MLRQFLHSRITAFERDYGYDMRYGHEMLDASLPAFLRFSRITGLAQHREEAPLPAWYAAKLIATLHEDCGPCAQLVATMAERAGVDPGIVRGIASGDEQAMGPEAALACRYTTAVLAHDPEADRLRAKIETLWGKRAVISLALAIASARVFPTVKYALGHGHACSRVRAGGIDVIPHQPDLHRQAAAA